MKTTIELPDTLFRSAKAQAAREGISLRMFVERAVTSELGSKAEPAVAPGWQRSFGRLKDIKSATRSVQRVVDREFSRIDPESWTSTF